MAIEVKSIIDQIAFEIGDVEKQKLPPKFYIKIINRSITDIYNWLLQKEIYYDIKTEDINLVANQQLYSTASGKTIKVFKDGRIELQKRHYNVSFEYNFTADPQYYFEILTQMGFIPIPNAVKTIKRHYIPFVPLVTGTKTDETIAYPDIFEQLIVVVGCLPTMTLAPIEEKEWLQQKSELFPLWQQRERELKNTILKYYEPIYTTKNIFKDV